jgi:hypothetical protein
MAKFNPGKVHNFVCVDRDMIREAGSCSFNSYDDHAGVFGNPGARIIYNQGRKDRNGKPVGQYFTLDQSHYNLQARDNQMDYDGIKLYDFLANSPYCEGSPNGDYREDPETKEIKQYGVKFKLLNTAADAKIAVDAKKQRVAAEASALGVDDETLTELAAHLGVFGEADELMRNKVSDWASKRPKEYFEVLNSGDRPIRAVVRKALEDGIFKKKGEVIYWDNTMIGASEDIAVATLLQEKDMLSALKEKMALVTDVKTPGKPGRPPKK